MADPVLVLDAGLVLVQVRPADVAELALVLRRGVRDVRLRDGVPSPAAAALLAGLERAARAFRADEDAGVPEAPPERLCRVCGVRPAAPQRTVCRTRVCRSVPAS